MCTYIYVYIAISSLLGKLFDIIILEEQHHGLITDELQFGFKKNASTVLCTSLLMETVEYYNENDTDCYLLLLDASKAFDRVEYVKLFTTLPGVDWTVGKSVIYRIKLPKKKKKKKKIKEKT